MRTQLRASRIALPRATALSYALLLVAVLAFGLVLNDHGRSEAGASTDPTAVLAQH